MTTVGAFWSARTRSSQLGLRRMVVFLVLCSASAVRAQEAATPVLSGGIETETNSRYIWRGLAFSDRTVQQTNLYASAAHFTGSVWLNNEYASPTGQFGLNEVDLILAYQLAAGPFSVEPSFSHYSYPNQVESPATRELGARFAYEMGFLSVRSEQSLDIRTYPGAYYGDLGLAFQADLSQRSSIETSAYFGWASNEFAMAYVGEAPQPFHVAGFSGRLYYYPARWLYFSPHISYSSILSPGYAAFLEERNLWQAGLAVGSELP